MSLEILQWLALLLIAATTTITIGPCAGCCDSCSSIPDILDFTIADFESCGCVGNPGDPHSLVSVAGANGSFFGLTRVTGENYWRKELFETVFQTYSDDGCTALIDETTIYFCAFLLCGDGGALTFLLLGSLTGYPATPFDPGFTAFLANPSALGVSASNATTTCGGFDPWGGGTVLVEAP